jgi:hypothetical protein
MDLYARITVNHGRVLLAGNCEAWELSSPAWCFECALIGRRLADVIFVVLPELGFGFSRRYRGLAVEADGVVGAVLIAPMGVNDDEFRDIHICLFLWGEDEFIAGVVKMMFNIDRWRN